MNGSTVWNVSWSVRHEFTSGAYLRSSFGGFAAYVAIQHGLGLLPERRAGSSVDHFARGSLYTKKRVVIDRRALEFRMQKYRCDGTMLSMRYSNEVV